jgi:type IV pilus assembly protein PilQ
MSSNLTARALRTLLLTATFVGLALLGPLSSNAASPKQGKKNSVTDLKVHDHGAATVVEVSARSRPLFTVFKREGPPRLAIDIAGGRFKGIPRLQDVSNKAVSQVATAQFRTGKTSVARLMIKFREPSHYTVRTSGNKLLITVTPKSAPSKGNRGVTMKRELAQVRAELSHQRSVAAAAVEAATQLRKATLAARKRYEALSGADRTAAKGELRRAELKLKEAEQARQTAAADRKRLQGQLKASRRQLARSSKPARRPQTLIRDIRFVDRKRSARVEILLGQGVAPVHQVMEEGKQPVLLLAGARLPKLLQRTLDASEFSGPVKRITSYISNSKQGTVAVKVALGASGGKSHVRRSGNKLIWEFPKGRFAARTPRKRGRSTDKGPRTAYTYKSTRVAGRRVRRRKRRAYSGRRIDLDFKGADIHNILRLLSDVGNINIITSDKVSGKVTIRMRNVPWDQAMDVILRAKGLGQVREGNLVRVAPMTDLEKEREAELARQKQIVLLKPIETRLIPISYAQAKDVLPKLKYMMSPRGKLTFDQRTNMVIARDISGNLDLMEKLIRNLDTQTPQVLIESRIVEARSNYTKELGIQWGGSFISSQGGGNSTGLVFPNQIGIGGGATDAETPLGGLLLGQSTNPNFAVNLPATAGSGSGGALGLTLGSVSGNVNINLRLSAAESMGDIRIVSAPKITTMDNVTATIEQGVTIPYSQVSAAGVQTTFKDAKLNLTVTPHVTADGSIIMKVRITNNEPDFVNTGPRGEPTILKKEAKTELLIKDGDTTVIGGIYTTRTGHTTSKIPWFADIPILGYFFRYRKDTSDRQEVLVFITPRIINRSQSIGR